MMNSIFSKAFGALALSGLFVWTLVCPCLGQAAPPIEVEIENQTGYNIQHLYLSQSGREDWSIDQMDDPEDGILEAGDSLLLSELNPGFYDLKISTTAGGQCILRHIELKPKVPAILTDGLLATCANH